MQLFKLQIRRSVAVLLAILLAAPALSARPVSTTSVKEQVLMIRPGSSIEVRLLDKVRIRGRLGAVTDAGFELQTVASEKTGMQQIGFERVQSIRDRSQTSFGHSLGRGFMVAGIVLVGIVVIYFAACQGVCGG